MNWKKTGKAALAAAALALAMSAFLCERSAGGAAGVCTAAADWLLRLQPAPTWWFLGVLLATFVAGRLFCECFCPLGVAQSFANWLFHPRSKVRRVCTRLPQGKAQRAVRYAFLAAFAALVASGAGAAAYAIAPYSIFGKAMTLFLPGALLFAAILAAAACGKGRVWCNWVCPAGTLFSAISVFSLSKHKVEKSCAGCRACFPKAAPAEKSAGKSEAGEGGANGAGSGSAKTTRRETLKGMAILAAAEAATGGAEKTTDGGFAPVSLHAQPDRGAPLAPPNAVERGLFDIKCVACGRCMEHCKGGCLTPSLSARRFGQPEMDFRKGYCIAGCAGACAKSCPTGAIRPFGAAKRRDLRNGTAVWTKKNCIRATEEVECTACSRKCPAKAITIIDGFPKVDQEKCTGCGACEHVCPARPEPAIAVKAAL